MVPNVSQLLTKNNAFPLNQPLTCANFGIYVVTSVICHVMKRMLGKLATNFPKDGQRIAAIRTNMIVKVTMTRTK